MASLLLLLVAAAALTGCTGLPTASERAARAQLQAQGQSYRPGTSQAALPVLSTNSTLGVLLSFAMLNQPKVAAAYYDWAASVERITTARSLPDPQLTFQMDIADVVTSIMPGLMMSFPGPGKLRAGAEIASAESQARYYAFQGSVLESAYEVKRSFYQLHFLDQRIRVNRETLALLGNLETLARAQNEVGKVTLQDVLRAQIEQDRVKTETTSLEDSRQTLLAQFSAALGFAPGQAPPPVPSRFEPTELNLTSEKLLESVLANNKRLRGMEAEVRAAEAAITLARRGRIPDSSIGLMADAKMSPVLYRPLATVSLPIWRDKIAAQIAEAQANKRAAEARLSAEQIALAVSLAEKSFLFREANRNLELLRQQLLPRTRQSLEVARSGYLGGQIDFFNLIDTERTLLGFEVDLVEAATQRELALTEISLLAEGMSPAGAPMGPSTPISRGSPSTRKANGPGMSPMR